MAKKLKLSPWHDVSVKPVHVGVYEFKDIGKIFNEKDSKWYRLWDGKSWRFGHDSVRDASEEDCRLNVYDEQWRGVLK